MNEEVLFKQNNSISEIAWAFAVFSWVPYLGVLFLPFAFIFGIAGFQISIKKTHLSGRKLSINSLISSFIVFAVQILLWYLLYLIPELSRKF
jgi:predicted neutral ceramidase superfamily lipid hydrolase